MCQNPALLLRLALFFAWLPFGRMGVILAEATEAGTTVLPATVMPAVVPPGSPFKVTYNWKTTGRLPRANTVFVHFIGEKGDLAFQADHVPYINTDSNMWTGDIGYTVKGTVPEKAADGSYKILVGLYSAAGREILAPGQGVADAGDRRYEVGVIKVDHSAPKPKPDTEGPVTLDLSGYKITFQEEFDGPLDFSPWGPGTKWIAHTPWDGDFGDAAFTDSAEDSPFKIENGVLRIEARKEQDPKDKWKRAWRSGLLASTDSKGKGFSQKYGYFEMRAKLPTAPGVWPAFWLASIMPDPREGVVEIDVLEFYGHFPSSYSSVVHVWKPEPHRAAGTSTTTKLNQVADGFHNYGTLVEPDGIRIYFDGVEVWKTPTPPEHILPLGVLLNLALGSGWPIDKVPSPTYMYVDHVRVYGKK